MTWAAEDLTWLGVSDPDSDGDIITIRIGTPVGEMQIMGEVELQGRTLVVRSAHIQSQARPNSVGIKNLKAIAAFVLERTDCDEAKIEGAPRTTGAGRGHRPRPFRFAR